MPSSLSLCLRVCVCLCACLLACSCVSGFTQLGSRKGHISHYLWIGWVLALSETTHACPIRLLICRQQHSVDVAYRLVFKGKQLLILIPLPPSGFCQITGPLKSPGCLAGWLQMRRHMHTVAWVSCIVQYSLCTHVAPGSCGIYVIQPLTCTDP